MALAYLLLFSSCLLQWSCANTPVIHDAKIPASSQCDESDPFEDDQELMEKLRIIHQQLPAPGCNSPSTCIDILRCNSSALSGYYKIQAINGSTVEIYCDMEGTNCGGEGGWMRVAHLNTESSSQCPVDFKIETDNNKTFCIRADTSNTGCESMQFESLDFTYSQVCGLVRGYSKGSVDGFANSEGNARNARLNGVYVDGVSITYGTSFTHLWTYAACHCPCNNPIQAPSFVSSDFYCEAGSNEAGWHTSDPLWNGMQCGGQEVPCCNHTGLPWFHKNTLTSTIAPIKVRVCLDEDTSNNENIGIERLELYIK